MRILPILLLVCTQCSPPQTENSKISQQEQPYLIVLGNVQDAGSPHAACQKACCKNLFRSPSPNRMVVSLGLVDPTTGSSWLFEATPDLPRQMKMLSREEGINSETPNGIFLTHAHIGHYAGLMFLGHEIWERIMFPYLLCLRCKSI